MALVGGLAGVLVGGAWYVVNLEAGQGLFGFGNATRPTDGAVGVAARATRYLVETVELPGGKGADRFLFAVAAGVVAVVRWSRDGRAWESRLPR